MTEKPVWIRHDPGCKARVFNDPIDIAAHQRLCPADLERGIRKLERRITELETRIHDVETTELPAEVDIDTVGTWENPDTDDDAYDDEPDDDPPTTTNPAAGFTFTGQQPTI